MDSKRYFRKWRDSDCYRNYYRRLVGIDAIDMIDIAVDTVGGSTDCIDRIDSYPMVV